jgi:hypothetical protein
MNEPIMISYRTPSRALADELYSALQPDRLAVSAPVSRSHSRIVLPTAPDASRPSGSTYSAVTSEYPFRQAVSAPELGSHSRIMFPASDASRPSGSTVHPESTKSERSWSSKPSATRASLRYQSTTTLGSYVLPRTLSISRMPDAE